MARRLPVDARRAVVDATVKEVDVPQEIVDERASPGDGRPRRACPTCSILPPIHHRDVIGDFERLVLIVRHEDAGDADLVVQLPQPAPQLQTNLRVERAERFVQEQDARLDGERARQRDALALAAGELRRIAAGLISQLDQIEQFADRARECASRDGRIARGRTRRPKATFSKTVM